MLRAPSRHPILRMLRPLHRSTPQLVAAALALALGVVSSPACKPHYRASEAVPVISDVCCRLGDETMTKFTGCRLTERCSRKEPIWLSGAVTCGPVEKERCIGGRCCEHRPHDGAADAPLKSGEAAAEAEAEAKAEEKTPTADPDSPAEMHPADSPADAETADAPSQPGAC